jgi:hypothetical protein
MRMRRTAKLFKWKKGRKKGGKKELAYLQIAPWDFPGELRTENSLVWTDTH